MSQLTTTLQNTPDINKKNMWVYKNQDNRENRITHKYYLSIENIFKNIGIGEHVVPTFLAKLVLFPDSFNFARQPIVHFGTYICKEG